MIDAYLNQTAQKKVTAPAVFYDGPAAASLDLDMTEIGEDFKVKIIVSGGDCTGRVDLSGKLDGSPLSEYKTYTMCRTFYSDYTYDKLTSVTTSGLADEDPIPNIKLVAVDAGHAEIVTTTWQDFACRWEDKAISYWTELGELTLSDAKVICKELIEAGDFIRLESEGGLGHQVMKKKPTTMLGGSEAFRTLLL